MLPNEVQLALKVLNVGGDGNNSILVGYDDDILTACAIGTETAGTATPHLVAVALHPVAGILGHAAFGGLFGAGTGIDALHLLFRHLSDPFGGNQLLAVPLPLLQQQLSHLRQVLGLQVESPTTTVDALRTLFPAGLVDTKRLEETSVQVVNDFLASHLLYDSRKHIGAYAVIKVELAWFVDNGMSKERRRPVLLGIAD